MEEKQRFTFTMRAVLSLLQVRRKEGSVEAAGGGRVVDGQGALKCEAVPRRARI